MKKYIDILNDYGKVPPVCDTFEEILDKVNSMSIPKTEDPKKNAIIVLGYSGNGKTTTIRKFLELHPEYLVVSIDSICRRFVDIYKRYPLLDELQSIFGATIEMYSNANLIFDGNFLNLFNRMALSDYLHSLGYNVNMIDLTPNLDETLPSRIMDETEKSIKRHGSGIPTTEEYAYYYKDASERITDFYMEERKRAFMDEQEEHETLHMGADKVIGMHDDLELAHQIGSEERK